MTSKAGHTFTAGPWDYFVGNANGRGLVRVEAALTSDDAGEHICSFPRGSKGEAHAALVAEAGTVLHETSLTPRQLAERCEELVAALTFTQTDPCFVLLGSVTKDEIAAILAKATAGGAV
jgi:hypothetical protein